MSEYPSWEPSEDQVNDWNIHNDHADGIEEDYWFELADEDDPEGWVWE